MITPTWILANLIVLFGAFITGITGFGFVLIAAALLLLFLDVKTVVILNVILGTVVCLPVAWQARRHIQPRLIAVLTISSIAGLPLGIYVLSNVSVSLLKLIVISGIIVFAVLLALGFSFKVKKEIPACVVSGFISGALSNSAGLGGPPIIIFLLNQGWAKEVFRGNIATYFTLNGIAAAISLGVSKNLPADQLVYAFSLVPAVVIGVLSGNLLLKYINAALFRKIAIYLLLACGGIGIFEVIMVVT